MVLQRGIWIIRRMLLSRTSQRTARLEEGRSETAQERRKIVFWFSFFVFGAALSFLSLFSFSFSLSVAPTPLLNADCQRHAVSKNYNNGKYECQNCLFGEKQNSKEARSKELATAGGHSSALSLPSLSTFFSPPPKLLVEPLGVVTHPLR